MKPSDFDPEPPTNKIARTLSERSAKLVRDWRACSEKQRATIERIAERLAKLPKVKSK